jgi:uncharacterized protein YqeY
MSLREQITNDIKTAMREKNSVTLNALRMVQSAFKNHEMPEEECVTVIKKLVKQRKESIEQFGAANRQDLVDAETKELKLLETYLPAQLSREAIEKMVVEAIAAVGAKTVKEMGAVMKEMQTRTAGNADNKIVSEVIKSKLA